MTVPHDRQDRPALVLVDAFSTGSMLARQAAETHRVLHVRSRDLASDTFGASLPSALLAEDLTYPGHEADVLAHLTARRPVGVVAASEFGVEVADELAHRLGLRGNDPALSAARRDKSLMMDALSRAGVPTARQCRSDDPAALLDWWRGHPDIARLVVKPLDSAGSDDVYTCDSEQEVLDACRAVLGKTNIMLRVNEEVLAQEYLAGDEYIVNTVSRDGSHWFTDAWISRKQVREGGRRIYEAEDLLTPDDPVLDIVLPYIARALDALGITDGPAHSELILTARGPLLLETGARISGLANPAALDLCTGADQVSLTLDCHAGDGVALAARPARYPVLQRARCVNLMARRAVPLPLAAITSALERIPAFESVRFRIADGAPTRPTVDLNSSPGAVFLVHPDPVEIDNAHKVIRELEHELL